MKGDRRRCSKSLDSIRWLKKELLLDEKLWEGESLVADRLAQRAECDFNKFDPDYAKAE